MFRAESGFKSFEILCVLMAASLCAFCASTDSHLQDYPGAALYRQSAFAHGFIHGYEDGFHFGDEDYQLARPARELKTTPEFHSADGGYRGAYGDKELFRQGYREGLESGYQDSYRGIAFRAISVGRAVAQDLTPVKDRHSFELGFAGGYQSVRSPSEKSAAHSQTRTNACVAGIESSGQQSSNTDFCRGYLEGSRFARFYDAGRASGTLALQQGK